MIGRTVESKEKSIGPTALPSKSQRRREALELKTLAAELIKLNATNLDRVPLDDTLRSAIEEARRIRSNVARKRQLQFVAKLLRRNDPEPLFKALEAMDGEAREIVGRQHRAEAWRDFLMREGDRAVGVLVSQRSEVDTQAIRQLLRNARRESAGGRPPASARALFRLLRDMDELAPLPPLTAS